MTSVVRRGPAPRWVPALVVFIAIFATEPVAGTRPPAFVLNAAGYFEARGANVLVFNNWYSGDFSDSKLSGVELIHHGVRTATNGDVRLSPAPAQWDPIPQLVKRDIDPAKHLAYAELAYAKEGLRYRIEVEPADEGVLVGVYLGLAVYIASDGHITEHGRGMLVISQKIMAGASMVYIAYITLVTRAMIAA